MDSNNINTDKLDNDQKNNSSKTYEKLLNEFSDSRCALKKMLQDVEECKANVLKSVSDSNDYRNKYAREERLKTLSSFFDTEIKIRQEYGRSILSEIEVRRKLEKEDFGGEQEVDIKEIARQLAKLNKMNNNINIENITQ